MERRTILYFGAVICGLLLILAGPVQAKSREVDKVTASDGNTNDYFGYSVSISGDYALVGAYGDDSYRGSAYIFLRDGTTLTEQAKLTASDGAAEDEFGYSVSISGDYALVGAYGDDSYRGSAYLFVNCPTMDMTGDCFVDFEDFAVLANEWLNGYR